MSETSGCDSRTLEEYQGLVIGIALMLTGRAAVSEIPAQMATRSSYIKRCYSRGTKPGVPAGRIAEEALDQLRAARTEKGER